MLSVLVRRSVILLFIYASLSGADRNETLINAEPKSYATLLKSIEKEDTINDETALQKVLLEKLVHIDLNASSTAAPLQTPMSTDAYGDLFQRYVSDAAKKAVLSKKLQPIKIKIKTLEEEIKDSENNSSSLLTLQLQDAFYTKTLLLYQRQSSTVSSEMKQIADLLNRSLEDLKFDSKSAEKTVRTYRDDAAKVRNALSRLLIEKERLELLGDTRHDGTMTEQINKSKEEYNKAVSQTIVALFLNFSDALSHKDKRAFSIDKEIADEISKLENADSVGQDVMPLLQDMEKHHLGVFNTVKGSTEREFKDMASAFFVMISEPIFSINETPISILKMALSLLIFIIGFFIGGLYKVNIRRIAPHGKSINASTRTMLANLGYYAIVVMAFFIALNVLGINLSSIALVAGALSVGIGFGLQNIVLNFVSGLILMFERNVKVGDYVELSDSLRGHVIDIRMRSTILNTNANIDVIVPNQNFIQNNVINWTMNDKVKRFDIPFGVAYGTKPEKVIAVISDAVEKSGFDDMYNTPIRHARVVMTGMGNSSVDFELFVWIRGEEILHPKRTMSRFLIVIYNALYENGIEIPFPQQDLHIRSVDKEAGFQLFLNQLEKHDE